MMLENINKIRLALYMAGDCVPERSFPRISEAIGLIDLVRDFVEETTKENDRLREALEKCFSVMISEKFEPDEGKPSMVKDGTWDKAIAKARAALEREKNVKD